jgi:uncharacterized repeat protein (TIGR01451 family)
MSSAARRRFHVVVRPLAFALVAVGTFAGSSGSALAAEEQRAGWELEAKTVPTYPRPGGHAGIQIKVLNVGAAASEGPVTVTDTLPPGVTAVSAGANSGIEEVGSEEAEPTYEPELWECRGNTPDEEVAGATVVRCVNNSEKLPHLNGGSGTPDGPPENFNPEWNDQEIAIGIKAPETQGTLAQPNRVMIAGGDALGTASTGDPITVSSTPPPFGFANADAWFSNENGTLDTQAGSHPYEATFAFSMNDVVNPRAYPPQQDAGGEPRDLTFSLPPGFVGDPNAVPKCTREEFNAQTCPPATQVGVVAAEAPGEDLFNSIAGHHFAPVYNLVPAAGEPAEFGFQVTGINTQLGTVVRSGSDYGLNSIVNNIPQRDVLGSVLTLWGQPGNLSHSHYRVGGSANVGDAPFLTLPTSCEGPEEFSLSVSQWEHPDDVAHTSFRTHNANGEEIGFTGCEKLSFGTSITTSPDTSNSDTPAGLTVEVKPELGSLFGAAGLGSADIKNTTVTLPQGVVINPGQAAGLKACQAGEDGLTTPAEKEAGEEDTGPADCPNAAKVATDEIETPLLEHALKGSVYVLQSNPPELKLLVTASGEGVNLKLVGVVHLNEQTGQLVTTFSETPEFPFSDFKLSFSGGAQAALDTPVQCGTYGATSDFQGWSSPFISDAFPTASFTLTDGPEGGACPATPLPFAPTLTAGSTTDQAGGHTDFTMLLQRGDGQQRIERLQFKVPPGLTGLISSVPLCQEPQAAAGTCPASSQIGHTVVTSGPGPYPLVIPQPGDPEAGIFLTGPYKGAPFGLSIVTPVIAGPFNLGTVITRAAIEVDPRTAQITITTDPLPQIVDGVPTDLRSVDAVVDRPGFMINPTSCEPSSFSGTAWGTPPAGAGGPGASAAISSHFGMGSCRSLQFKPSVSTVTKAKASKANGASLSFKISYPKGAIGSDSWFDEAQFDIPRQLPARLSTLQQSCLAATFETNRAACPKASVIGHAVVHTPLLPVPLEGPVYFVSYGATKFPDAVLDLTGDHVHVELHGETFISKTSVTSATFRNTPDVPFESIEVNVPMGPYSEFGANLPPKDNYDFCGQKLKMPTFFKAQNGLEIHQETPVTITGCPKAKKAKKKGVPKHGKTAGGRKVASKR